MPITLASFVFRKACFPMRAIMPNTRTAEHLVISHLLLLRMWPLTASPKVGSLHVHGGLITPPVLLPKPVSEATAVRRAVREAKRLIICINGRTTTATAEIHVTGKSKHSTCSICVSRPRCATAVLAGVLPLPMNHGRCCEALGSPAICLLRAFDPRPYYSYIWNMRALSDFGNIHCV